MHINHLHEERKQKREEDGRGIKHGSKERRRTNEVGNEGDRERKEERGQGQRGIEKKKERKKKKEGKKGL
jgi:hypothetical protein